MRIRTNRYGKKVLQITQEFEIDETVDVDINIELSEIINELDAQELAELIFEMGKEGREAISKHFSIEKQNIDLHGESLKRHLCDIIGGSYATPVNDIIAQLIFKLNS